MRLTSDVERIRDIYGFHPVTQLLAPGIRMDDPKMVTPLVADSERGRCLLAREQETGNLQAHTVPPDELRFFERYVSFDNMVTGSTAAASLADAVSDLAGDEAVAIEGDLPYGRYLQLADALGSRVSVASDDNDRRTSVVVYRVPCAEVLTRFERLRAAGVPAAKQVIASRPHLSDLKSILEPGVDTRFTTLDGVLRDLGAAAVLCAAPPNVSELLGQPSLDADCVLWARGSDDVFVVVSTEAHAVSGSAIGSYRSVADAVRDVVGTEPLAIEEGWLDVGLVLRLRDAGVNVVTASAALSRWRELRDREDVSFALVAAQASRYCIEGALGYAQEQLDAGAQPTERDVYRRYLDLIHEFRRDFDIRFPIQPFFANCHAADRTIYPAIPVDYPLTDATKTLKFDSGMKVMVEGVVMGTSDVARTLVRSPEGREAYELFTRIVRDDVIANLRPGTVCAQVHRDCVDRILDHEGRLVELDLMPTGVDMHTEYGRRNVGHLMGKQESFTTEFRPGHEFELVEGSIGAVEIQWPYRDHSIAAEDLWYVGKTHTYVTSA